uniref:Uncharacterized protein n=1 Tax=Romanomermis culicivorax TaxID=13658 RepID=A0A915JRS4_ROMCU
MDANTRLIRQVRTDAKFEQTPSLDTIYYLCVTKLDASKNLLTKTNVKNACFSPKTHKVWSGAGRGPREENLGGPGVILARKARQKVKFKIRTRKNMSNDLLPFYRIPDFSQYY